MNNYSDRKDDTLAMRKFKNGLKISGISIAGTIAAVGGFVNYSNRDLHKVYRLQTPVTICEGENFANERIIPENTYYIGKYPFIIKYMRNNECYFFDNGNLSEGRMKNIDDLRTDAIGWISNENLYKMDTVATVKDLEPYDPTDMYGFEINIKENPNSRSETISTVHPGDSILIDSSKTWIDSKRIKYINCIAFNEDGITYGWIPEKTVEVTDTIEWNIPSKDKLKEYVDDTGLGIDD